MATQDQQMQEMLQDGGMKDDGMDRDPVSGNEVPPGSLASEFRDDIPAQLSEGEYVIPADAVQYHGLRFYEQSVQDAKRGLAEMQANGRIGGTPMPTNQESGDAPVNFNIEDFMAEIGAEPQQQDMPMQANKGGLVRGFAPGGSSSNIYTPDLDFTNVQEKFPSGTKSYHTRRYINDKCEIKLINSTAEGSPAMSVPEDFVKVVSNDGLKRLKSCGLNDPEMGLTDEEKEILGPDKVKEYEDGTLPEEEATKSPEETQAPPKSEREDKPRDSSDFITTWDATDFENYVDDFEARASSGATWFDKTLGKIFTPIMEFNQPYILGRAYQLITTGNLSDEEIQKILPVFKLTYGDPKATMSGVSYNAEGQKVPINFVWDAERGMYVQGDIDAIINSKEIEIPDLQIDKENKDDKDNTEPGDLSSLNLTGEGSLERLGPGGDSMLTSNSPAIAKRIADMRKNQTRISDAYGGGSGPNLASGKFNRTPPSSTDGIDSGSVLVNRQKDRENDRDRDRDDNTIDAEKISKPTVIKDRTDSSGKKVGQKGYKSALRERKEREKIEAAQEAGKGYKGGFGFNEGGTPTKKSLAKKRTTKKK